MKEARGWVANFTLTCMAASWLVREQVLPRVGYGFFVGLGLMVAQAVIGGLLGKRANCGFDGPVPVLLAVAAAMIFVWPGQTWVPNLGGAVLYMMVYWFIVFRPELPEHRPGCECARCENSRSVLGRG